MGGGPSARTFQAALVRLVIDPPFRDTVRAQGEAALPAGLRPIDRRRLVGIASDRGLDINRTLHVGFRLGKLRAMLPLTCTLLGRERLLREAGVFWAERPPSSFYFLPEAVEFGGFLQRRRLRVRYLAEVVAFEVALLELERARVGSPPPQRVAFEHDPTTLLGTLAAGRRPRGLPSRPCVAVGTVDASGRVQWHLEEAG